MASFTGNYEEWSKMPRQHELRLPTASAKQQAVGKDVWNAYRNIHEADFFTLGYSGRSIEDVIRLLNDGCVRTLWDVRTHAISMYKPAFSKSNLRSTLEEHGFAYEHHPEFGVPRDIRAKAIAQGSREVIWDWYDAHVVSVYVGSNLHQFFNGAEHPIAFMCSETDPHECHRHRLALGFENLGLKSYDL